MLGRSGLALLCLLVVRTGEACAGRTIFVRVNGNDAADGLSAATALRSLTQAAAVVQPGDTVVVGPGRYVEGNIKPARTGTALRPVVFTADEDGERTGDGPGPVLIDATGLGSGFFLQSALSYVVIDGFAVTGATDAGITVKSGSDQVTVANCRVFSNAGHGILIQDVRNAMVFNNLSYANGQDGILLTGFVSGPFGISVINNTAYANQGRGLFLGSNLQNPASNVTVVNNIFAGNYTADFQVGQTSTRGITTGYNLIWNRLASGSTADVTDVRADPLFVNAPGADGILGGLGFADDDFHLSDRRSGQAVNSPALDAGADTGRAFNLARSTTRTNGRHDYKRVDLGYHYGNRTLGPRSFHVPFKRLYVAVNGDDANSGLRPGAALRTISRAAQLARRGNEVIVTPGLYREGDIRPAFAGFSGRPIIFRAMNEALYPRWPSGLVVVNARGWSSTFRLATASGVTIDGFVMTGGSAGGIYVKSRSRDITIRNNVAVSNSGNGIYVIDSFRVAIENNLTYANSDSGIAVGASTASDDVLIQDNTSYGNMNRGIFVGVGGTAVTNAIVTENITAGNAIGGLQVSDASLPTLVGDYNLVADLYGGNTPAGPHDVNGNPLFINPAGVDGILGGDGFDDDDFRLAQRRGGQRVDSPAIDVSPYSAASRGFQCFTTAENGVADIGQLDLGFHYRR